ncbi:MAG: hypothetical protein HY015_02305 [Bacteroidetes bacterium]|nr:hypothetical protein [Bacteroidota bacterium]MBI3481803.1 hypothetical protein [Bacteroidota bacterium]
MKRNLIWIGVGLVLVSICIVQAIDSSNKSDEVEELTETISKQIAEKEIALAQLDKLQRENDAFKEFAKQMMVQMEELRSDCAKAKK